MTIRNFSAVLALGALAALPACSMFGGHSSDNSQANAAPPPPPASSSPSMAGNAGNSMSSNDMTPATPPSHRTIRQAQAKLKQAADYPGKIDGAWGPMTESGVRKWQQAHNLNASGQLDAATLQSLNIQPSGHASNQRTSSQGTIGGQTSSNT